MWLFSNSKSRSRALGTMGVDLSKIGNPDPLPKKPVPPLKVFVSHRWGRDKMLFKTVTGSLRTGGYEVEDLSLSEEERVSGPRGGRVDDVVVKLKISDRIDKSDIVIAPAEKLSPDAHWVVWELDCAAQRNKPILFLSDDPDRQQFNGRFAEYQRAGLNVRRSNADPEAILEAVRAMLPGRQH